MSEYLLSIDQGTTSSRAMLFTHEGELAFTAQREFRQYFPHDGWVEHDPEEIWQSVLDLCREVIAMAKCTAASVTAIGITNQRETTIVWERETGKAVYNAIVWQDRRTAGYCKEIGTPEVRDSIQRKTGLILDSYFSGTKVRWILDNIPNGQQRAEAGELLFGTVDSYLVWKMTGGQRHITDATNASRTMLFNIMDQQWDEELLSLFEIPSSMLPEVLDCAADFGTTEAPFMGEPVAISAIAGDQQAALVGQACFEKGMCKSTYGTGCFLVMNTGSEALLSQNRLLTTVGYRLNGETTYALEGSIFMAGATMQWLRDGLKILPDTSESSQHADAIGPDHSVYLVPAFTGLGAPHWDPNARGAIVGLTRDTGISAIITAGLQAVCYQTRDILEAMKADGISDLKAIRVDGGMAVNDWFAQFLSDLLRVEVQRPDVVETTARGVAMLAALQQGVFKDLGDISAAWHSEKTFVPQLDVAVTEKLYQGWLRALAGIQQITSED